MDWTEQLDNRHSGEILRLIDYLDDGRQFCLILAEFNNSSYRDRVIAELASHYTNQAVISAADTEDLLATLQHTAQQSAVIHIVETRHWFADGTIHPVIQRLNQRREWLAQLDCGMVLWLSVLHVNAFAHTAPDLWAWRKAVVDFCNYVEDKPVHAVYSSAIDSNNTDYPDKQQRLTEISDYLTGKTTSSLADTNLWLEKSRILASMGDLDAAMDCAKQSLHISQEYHDRRATAVSYGDIADILQARGELDKALRIRREEELPVYEALGDKRSKAMTMSQIADVLQARGELDEALRIRREEELPVYEALGDKREKAVTMGRIADVLQDRGELDEALRIRREEQLPVYEALGDKHSKAVTMGKIADVLQARGELNEALRIYREEELPVYEALGDKRNKAVTIGKIATVLQARGELDEALRIRREELLVYEALGNKRSLLIRQTRLALLLQQIDTNLHAQEIRQLLTKALSTAEQLKIPQQEFIREQLQALPKENS